MGWLIPWDHVLVWRKGKGLKCDPNNEKMKSGMKSGYLHHGQDDVRVHIVKRQQSVNAVTINLFFYARDDDKKRATVEHERGIQKSRGFWHFQQ